MNRNRFFLIYVFFIFDCLLLMAMTSCDNNNKRVLTKEPSSRYIVEYQDSTIIINFEFKDRDNKKKKSSFALYYKDGLYYDKEDSALVLSVKDTTICEYDRHFNSVHFFRCRKLSKNLYVAENYTVYYPSAFNGEQKSIRSGHHYYYDEKYKIKRIHRSIEIDDYVVE